MENQTHFETSTLGLTRRRAILSTAVALGGIGLASTRAWAEPDDGISHTAESIHQEPVFKATPKRVYEALTDAKQFDKIVQLSEVMKSMPGGGKPAEISSEVGGAFAFFANWHEPGAQTLLGRVYEQTGRAQGEAALRDLARHPATARHVATKFSRYFVADQPPRELVEALTKNFLSTDGDLTELCRTLIDHDAAWRAPLTKIRTPQEFVVAAMRATGFAPREPGPVLNVINALGMPLWQPGGPNGFADMASVWASPEQMKLRLDASWQMAQRAKDVQPMAALETTFGEAVSRETREAVSRAESRPQALALLFMSPEFQRR